MPDYAPMSGAAAATSPAAAGYVSHSSLYIFGRYLQVRRQQEIATGPVKCSLIKNSPFGKKNAWD
jgi:hypothetical protein